MRRLQSLMVVVFLMGAITANGASASATETDDTVVTGPPALACDVVGGAILWEHPNPLSRNPKLINSNTAIATGTPVAAGKYVSTTGSWDSYKGRVNATQLNEQWYLDIGGVTTSKTSDLADQVASAYVEDNLGTYTFPDGELVLRWGGQRTDSVIPSAVCLTPVEEAPLSTTAAVCDSETGLTTVTLTNVGEVSFIGTVLNGDYIGTEDKVAPGESLSWPLTAGESWLTMVNGVETSTGVASNCLETPPTTTTTTTVAPIPITVEASCEAVSVTGPEDAGGSVSFLGEGQLAWQIAFDGLPVTVAPQPWTGVIEWSVSANGSIIDSGSLGECNEAPPPTTTTVAPTTTTSTTTEAPVPNGDSGEDTSLPLVPIGVAVFGILVVAFVANAIGNGKVRREDSSFR